MKKKDRKKTKKNKLITLRVSKEEKQQLKTKAEYLNMTVSQLLLETSLSPTSINVVPSINGKLFTELCRQGNNLNQLSRNLNIQSKRQEIPKLNRQGITTLEELEKTVNQILEILSNQHK